jgi:hypothetical protein
VNFADVGKGETQYNLSEGDYSVTLAAAGATLSFDLGTEVHGILSVQAEKWDGSFNPHSSSFIGVSWGTSSGNLELYFWDDTTQADITSEVGNSDEVTYRVIYFYY